ncbi:MAG TPA: T9SS type A sorting domain-containing protein [Bacteroidia bacterium]|nr:T9SS type A sorting domain-containing protein [Bacteroidia bacterium]
MNRKFTAIVILFFSFLFFSKNSYSQEEKREREYGAEEIKKEKDYSFLQDVEEFQRQYSKTGSSRYAPAEELKTGSAQASAFNDLSFFGPYNLSGRTRAILPDMTDPNLLFAGVTTGGLWKSTDAGLSWSPINDQTIGNNLTCIDQNPFNPDIIYYGTGEHKNRKIEDKGNGIYKSTDHGLTFSQIPGTDNTSFELINALKHSLVDPNTIYVGTTFNGLYRSNDGGTSWQTIFDNGEKITDIECFTDGKVMFTASYDGIYYSPTGDSGTFTKSTGTPVNNFSRIEMAYCDSFPLVMYALFADSVQSNNNGLEGAYKSTDGGVSWFSINNPDVGAYFPFGDFILAIAVKPDDPDFFVPAGAYAYYSTDGGQTYTHILYQRFDQHVLVFSKFNNNLLYNGTDQGINSFDLTQFPLDDVDLNYSFNTLQIWNGTYFPTGNNFLISTQDNVFCKNSNGDSVFVRIPSYGSDGKSLHVNQQAPDTSYISGDFGELFRSVNTLDPLPVYAHILNELDTNADGDVDDDVWHENMLEMNYLDGNQLYFPTRDHIWRTVNGGNNWTKISNSFAGGNDHPYSLGISNDIQPVIYSAGNNGFFIRIDDAYNAVAGQEVDLSASVPAPVAAGGKITCVAVHPLDDATLYVTVQDDDPISKVWEVTNANTASPIWTDISSNLDPANNIYWIEMDPDHPDSVLFIGTDYGLWSTADAGTTWVRETDVPLISVFQMRLRRSDRKLFIYTFGRGIWIGNLDSSTDVPEFDAGNNGINVIPNPTHGHFTLFAIAEENEHFTITMNDISGRKILQAEAHASKDKLRINLDISRFSNGLYFLNLHNNNTSRTIKIVKN